MTQAKEHDRPVKKTAIPGSVTIGGSRLSQAVRPARTSGEIATEKHTPTRVTWEKNAYSLSPDGE